MTNLWTSYPLPDLGGINRTRRGDQSLELRLFASERTVSLSVLKYKSADGSASRAGYVDSIACRRIDSSGRS